MRANFRGPRRASFRVDRRAVTCLFIVSIAARTAAQTTTTTFTPGGRELFVLDLKTLGNNGLPNGVTVPGPAKPTVVMKDGVPMLRAKERTDLIIHLPENLPDAFTLQFEVIPKVTGAPEDFSFEGTPETNRGEASMHVVWQVPTLIAVGGGEYFQMPIPDSIGLTLPLNLTNVDVSFDHGTFALFTNGRLLTDPLLTNRQFVRGRILRVTLGGGCGLQDENCPTPDDIDKYSVHLSKLRIAAGGGVVANQNTANQSPAPALSGPANRNTEPKTFTVTVISGPKGPVVSWPLVAQANGYAVSRRKIDDASCCNTSSGNTYGAVSPWQDAPLPMTGTYVYRVTAATPAGQIYGETEFGFRKPEVASSTPVNAVPADPVTTGTITPMTVQPSTPSTVTKSTMVDRNAPLNVPTGPAPTNLRFAGIPNMVQLEWDAVPGAVRYELSSTVAGSTTWTPLVVPPTAGTPFWVGSPADPTKAYTYRVIAYQSDGKMGETKADYKTPTMEPTNFTATPIGPGQVRLEWDNIQTQYDPSFRLSATTGEPATYLLSGPGTGTGFNLVGPATSSSERNRFTLNDVPAGSQTWTLTVNWDPGGVLTPSTSWTKASATVAPVVADPGPRYRLVAIGFKAIQQSKDIDDAHDGHGDEIYFSAVVNRTRLTGDSLPVTRGANLTMPMTRSHGDEAVSVPYGRIKAGSASATGGIRTGDVVPFAFDPAAPTAPLQTITFPLLLWQGTLQDSDAVVIHPMLWEDDVNPIVQATWMRIVLDAAMSGYITEPMLYDGYISSGTVLHTTAKQIRHLDSLGRRASASITSISNGLRLGRFDNPVGNRLFQCNIVLGNPVRRPCEAHGVDRPIGLEIDDSGGFYQDWFDRIILLTPATIKAALEGPVPPAYAAWPQGTFSLKLMDNIGKRTDVEPIANYELFFRIEKVP